MKLADMKRLPVGTELNLIHTLLGPCSKRRVLSEVKSNAFLFDCPDEGHGRKSWLYFPKASDFEATEKGFKIWEGGTKGDGILAAEYIFIKKGEE